ncbi:MAG: cadherin domain-containing protein [Planctomycetaceae bacterium]
MVLQPDGKIVVTGHSDNFFAVARYNVNGSLDTSFDGDGMLTTQVGIGSGYDQPHSVALQQDGKIIVAGKTTRGGATIGVLVRYNSDGQLDSSFGVDGKLTITNVYESSTVAYAVRVQTDGRIVVAGAGNGLALFRYFSDGSLDTSFDSDGRRNLGLDVPADPAMSMELQNDGAILVALTRNADFKVVRLTPDGGVDLAFGANGAVSTDFGFSTDWASDIALQSDGKIVVTGVSDQDRNYRFAVARYLSGNENQQPIDRPPRINSPPTVAVFENTSAVLTITATDPEGHVPLFGITGGADQSKFNLNFLTGALSFIAPPDFEHPSDADQNNCYEVQVAVSDGINLVTQNVEVNIGNVNEAPTITSNGGGATAAVSVPENQTAVTFVTSADVDNPAQIISYSITGGPDAASFTISNTGLLTFLVAPNFELPTDVGKDNVYEVEVTAMDNGTGNLTDVQLVTVTVTNVAPVTASPLITGPASFSTSLRPVFSWTSVNEATEYDLWITRSSGTSLFHGVSVSRTSYTPSADFGIGKFNLWVRAKNSDSIGPWTSKYTFTINTPVLLQPMTRLQPTLRPTITWDLLPGAVKYDVWVDDVSRGITQYIRNSNVTGPTFTPSAELPLAVYRAWVRAIATDGTAAAWSKSVEFVAMQAPVVTQGQNSTFTRSPAFAWDPLSGAASYEVIVRNRNTGATVLDQRNITGLSFTPATPLTDGPYRWWVVGVSAQGVRSFSTLPMDIYIGGRTELLSPTGTSDPTTLTFTWRPVDGAVRYDLWVNQVAGQAQVIRQQNLTGTKYTSVTSLPAGAYRAWIRAISATGEASPWSLEGAFTIACVAPASQSHSHNSNVDFAFAALTTELQVSSLELIAFFPKRRAGHCSEIKPGKFLPTTAGGDGDHIQAHNDVHSEPFSDELLVVGIEDFLENTCTQARVVTN